MHEVPRLAHVADLRNDLVLEPSRTGRTLELAALPHASGLAVEHVGLAMLDQRLRAERATRGAVLGSVGVRVHQRA
jgi:hypothetical protein